MMKLEVDVSGTQDAQDIVLLISVDQQPMAKYVCSSEQQKIEFDIDDTEEKSHVLEFWMCGKKPSHTSVDAQGNIVTDVLINIGNIEVDGINLDQVFFNKAQYQHDHNGTTDTVTDRFYGSMGCNGVVRLEFSTPFYIWLLENM